MYEVALGWAVRELRKLITDLAALRGSDAKTKQDLEKLKADVRQAAANAERMSKVQDHHGTEIETLKGRVRALESQARGLKIKLGRERAANSRLREPN